MCVKPHVAFAGRALPSKWLAWGGRGGTEWDEVRAVGRSQLGEVPKVQGEDFSFYSNCNSGRV